jgi:hypothetical protein
LLQLEQCNPLRTSSETIFDQQLLKKLATLSFHFPITACGVINGGTPYHQAQRLLVVSVF